MFLFPLETISDIIIKLSIKLSYQSILDCVHCKISSSNTWVIDCKWLCFSHKIFLWNSKMSAETVFLFARRPNLLRPNWSNRKIVSAAHFSKIYSKYTICNQCANNSNNKKQQHNTREFGNGIDVFILCMLLVVGICSKCEIKTTTSVKHTSKHVNSEVWTLNTYASLQSRVLYKQCLHNTTYSRYNCI